MGGAAERNKAGLKGEISGVYGIRMAEALKGSIPELQKSRVRRDQRSGQRAFKLTA
ncbi:hypothetical protein J14TS5_56780 [Paenibacillus lautus]|nr:hypothetical protein J14TS5_56780 [Paenibacillus lautus]